MVFESEREKFEGFNTASGKYCCNDTNTTYLLPIACSVSIPQAVSTVATEAKYPKMDRVKSFQYRKR